VTSELWDNAGIDVLVVPTASITPTIQEVLEVPVGINTILGYYTNFCNLLDLSVLALPNGFLPNGMPAGISLVGRAFDDELLYQLGRQFQHARNLPLGASQLLRAAADTPAPPPFVFQTAASSEVLVAVCGAHMTGLPLNGQLLALKATFASAPRTSSNYRLYDITQPGDKVARPGLVREPGGSAIALEVWKMTKEAFGAFAASVASPLSFGNVQLEDGSTVKGFLCEPFILPQSKDISSFGGWRDYMASKKQ
jgi:allophanate hydrolase